MCLFMAFMVYLSSFTPFLSFSALFLLTELSNKSIKMIKEYSLQMETRDNNQIQNSFYYLFFGNALCCRKMFTRECGLTADVYILPARIISYLGLWNSKLLKWKGFLGLGTHISFTFRGMNVFGLMVCYLSPLHSLWAWKSIGVVDLE